MEELPQQVQIWVALLNAIPPQLYWALAVVYAIGMLCGTIILLVLMVWLKRGFVWWVHQVGDKITRWYLRRMDRKE